MTDWSYDAWPSGAPYDWSPAERGDSVWDTIDFHVDLGCGRLKKGRIGVDHFPDPGVNIVCDLDAAYVVDGFVVRGPVTKFVPDEHKPNGVAAAPPSPFWGDRGLPGGTLRGLPFEDSSIRSIVSHHCFEHIGEGFVPLMDEVYRVLEPGGILRVITPLFPSRNAVEDPDHVRYFMPQTWETFCGFPDNHWHEGFATPYTSARFEKLAEDHTAVAEGTTPWYEKEGAREIRVALKARK